MRARAISTPTVQSPPSRVAASSHALTMPLTSRGQSSTVSNHSLRNRLPLGVTSQSPSSSWRRQVCESRDIFVASEVGVVLDSRREKESLRKLFAQRFRPQTVILVSVRKLSALQKWLLCWALKKRLAVRHLGAGISFAEIKLVAQNGVMSNAVNASISRACRRLQTRGLVRVVHGPAITQAERYRLKRSKRERMVAYRSWQAGIQLTDDGAKAARYLMPAGTQLEMLLEPAFARSKENSG